MADPGEDFEKQSDVEFWETWIKHVYPNLRERSYFVPEIHVNKTRREGVDGEIFQVKVLPQPAQEGDVKSDKAIESVLHSLKALADTEKAGGVMFVLREFEFKNYLSDQRYKETCATLPRPQERGEFDFLFLHRHYGVLVGEVKAVGIRGNQTGCVAEKMNDAIIQLQRAKRVLNTVFSDLNIVPRVKKTVILPNIHRDLLRQFLSYNTEMKKKLADCLEAEDSDPANLCLCADELSSPEKPWEVDEVLSSLQDWWHQRMAKEGNDSAMTEESYLTLVARFCGPASTVIVRCFNKTRISLKTMKDAVTTTSLFYDELLALYPEQLLIYKGREPRLFLTGPPGTGKTLLLQLRARWWLEGGRTIHIVSTGSNSRLITKKLSRLLKECESYDVQTHFFKFTSDVDKVVDAAVSELSSSGSQSPVDELFVIADEAGPTGVSDWCSCEHCEEWPQQKEEEKKCCHFYSEINNYLEEVQMCITSHKGMAGNCLSRHVFGSFCEKLHASVPNLHLWAANCVKSIAPRNWRPEVLTKLLRSPPAVQREIEKAEEFNEGEVDKYDVQHLFPHPTDGVKVQTFYHGEEHEQESLQDCLQCGQMLAKFLTEDLRVGKTDAPSRKKDQMTSKSRRIEERQLQYKDVVVLYGDDSPLGLLKGMKDAGIPVKEVVSDSDEDVVACRADKDTEANRDVVWALDGDTTYSLEWPVVICVGGHEARDEDDQPAGLALYDRLHRASRCTSQLVFLVPSP